MTIRNLFDLTDEVALVTGGAGAIGSVVAKGLAGFGAHVVVADVDLEGAEDVAHEIEKLGRKSQALRVDVSQQEDTEHMARTAKNSFGAINILFNNAGIMRRSPTEEFPLSEWEHVLQVNLTGIFLVAQAVAVTAMIPQKAGKIINTSSMQAFVGRKKSAAYTASKSGVVGLTKVMANDWGPYNIRVNSLAPSNLDTPMTAPVFSDPERKKLALSKTPLGRFGLPEDLVGAVVFLSSPASNYVTGQTLLVEGGISVG